MTDIKDGGTIEVNIDGVRKTVRYLGIDVPKVSPPECYGAQAAAKNSELVEGQFVELEPDVTDTERRRQSLTLCLYRWLACQWRTGTGRLRPGQYGWAGQPLS